MPRLIVRDCGTGTRYEDVFRAMRAFTDARGADTPDQLWLTEHQRVFTQGQAGKSEFLLDPGDIPVVQSDRGGQVTYHGPGQIVGYLLFDLRRRNLGVRDLVRGIEQAIVALLAGCGIAAAPRRDAPGVYVGSDKIAALGLRIRRGCSYHGLALNVDMDLRPYSRIIACGLAGTGATSIAALRGAAAIDAVREELVDRLARQFAFGDIVRVDSGLPAAPGSR